MSARDKSRFTPKVAVWIALGIFAAWLAFLFVPVPPKVKPVGSTELPPVAAQSKLEEVGLANNPDWQGLPGYFAIWAEKLKWRDDKAVFAYWNPGSHSYSYLFEATRKAGDYRYRIVSMEELSRTGLNYFDMDEGMSPQDVVERGTESPSHPFIFFERLSEPPEIRPSNTSSHHPPDKPRPRVDVDLKVESPRLPKTPELETKTNDAGK